MQSHQQPRNRRSSSRNSLAILLDDARVAMGGEDLLLKVNIVTTQGPGFHSLALESGGSVGTSFEALHQQFIVRWFRAPTRLRPCCYRNTFAAVGCSTDFRRCWGGLTPGWQRSVVVRNVIGGGGWTNAEGITRSCQRPVVLHEGVDRGGAIGDKGDDRGLRWECPGQGESIITVSGHAAQRALFLPCASLCTVPVILLPVGARMQNLVSFLHRSGQVGNGGLQHLNMDSGTVFPFKFKALPVPPTSNETMFTSFDTSPKKSTSRAEAQARYRERNKEAERERARLRMRARREEEKELARRSLLANLRSSAVFARYSRHVRRHSIAVYGDPRDPEYVKGMEQLNLKCWPGAHDVENTIERDDVIFMIQHAQPQRRTSTPDNSEIDSYVANLDRCRALARFDWDEGKPSRPLWYIHSGEDIYNEDDLEFMFWHTVPTPTIEDMDACGCT